MEDRDEGPVSICCKHPCTVVTRFLTGGIGIRKRDIDVNNESIVLCCDVLCYAMLCCAMLPHAREGGACSLPLPPVRVRE